MRSKNRGAVLSGTVSSPACGAIFSHRFLFLKPEPFQVKLASRKKDKVDFTFSFDRFKRISLFHIVIGVWEFHNLVNVALVVIEADMNTIHLNRRVTADCDGG